MFDHHSLKIYLSADHDFSKKLLSDEASKKSKDPANALLEKMKENMKKMELEKQGASPEKDKKLDEIKVEDVKLPDANILVYKKQLQQHYDILLHYKARNYAKMDLQTRKIIEERIQVEGDIIKIIQVVDDQFQKRKKLQSELKGEEFAGQIVLFNKNYVKLIQDLNKLFIDIDELVDNTIEKMLIKDKELFLNYVKQFKDKQFQLLQFQPLYYIKWLSENIETFNEIMNKHDKLMLNFQNLFDSNLAEENLEWNVSVANQVPLIAKFTEMANEFITFNNDLAYLKDRTLRNSSDDQAFEKSNPGQFLKPRMYQQENIDILQEDYQQETDILKEADACIDRIYQRDPFEFKYLKDQLTEFKNKFPKAQDDQILLILQIRRFISQIFCTESEQKELNMDAEILSINKGAQKELSKSQQLLDKMKKFKDEEQKNKK